MCSISEPYKVCSLSSDSGGFLSSCVNQGPDDTLIVTTSKTSAVLLKPNERTPVKTWFTKRNQTFSVPAVYCEDSCLFFSASGPKLLSWKKDDEACETIYKTFSNDILSIQNIKSVGIFVTFKDGSCYLDSKGLSFDKFEELPKKGKFCWAAVLPSKFNGTLKVYFLAENKQTVAVKEIIEKDKTVSEHIVQLKKQAAAWTIFEEQFFAILKSGTCITCDGTKLMSTQIQVVANEKINIAVTAVDNHHILFLNGNKTSLYNVPFGLEKMSNSFDSAVSASTCAFLNSNLYFISGDSLMACTVTVSSANLASLVGAQRRASASKQNAKTESALVPCSNAADQVFAKINDMDLDKLSKALNSLEDIPERYLVLAWKRLLAITDKITGKAEDVAVRIMQIPHTFRVLRVNLARYLNTEEAIRLLDHIIEAVNATCLTLDKNYPFNRLLSWMDAVLESHGSALALLPSAARTLDAANETLNGLEDVCEDMAAVEPYLDVIMKKTNPPAKDDSEKLFVVDKLVL